MSETISDVQPMARPKPNPAMNLYQLGLTAKEAEAEYQRRFIPSVNPQVTG